MVSLLCHGADRCSKQRRRGVLPGMAPAAPENRHHCLTQLLGALHSESYWGRGQKQKCAKHTVLVSAFSAAPEQEVVGYAACSSGMLLGQEAGEMAQWGSTWASQPDMSGVHALRLCSGFAVEKGFFPLLDSLTQTWVSLAKKLYCEQIWCWFGVLLVWIRSDDVPSWPLRQVLSHLFVYSEKFSHSLNRNFTSLGVHCWFL